MKKRTGSKYFEEWLKENKVKFIYVPIIYKRKDHVIRLRFKGIIPEIEAHVYDNNINITIIYHGIYWDILMDFDVLLRKHKAGKYYCGMCDPAHRKLYETERELYYNHSFEDFLKWANEFLNKSNYLVVHGKKDHYSYAFIVKPKDMKKYQDKESFVARLSLIKKY